MTGERGFLLLEAVIALVIASLALAALLDGTGRGLKSTLLAVHDQEAVSRARSRLAQLGASLRPGKQEGDDGGGYRWHVAVEPTEVAVGLGQAPALFAVTVAISWTMDGAAREVSLSSKRLCMLAPPGP